MQSVIKTKVTVATIYTVYSDKEKASKTTRYLFIGSPTKAEVKKAYDKTVLADDVKKSTVCETEKVNLEINFGDENLTSTVENLIIENAKNVVEFETSIID